MMKNSPTQKSKIIQDTRPKGHLSFSQKKEISSTPITQVEEVLNWQLMNASAQDYVFER